VCGQVALSNVKVTVRLTVGQSVSQAVGQSDTLDLEPVLGLKNWF